MSKAIQLVSGDQQGCAPGLPFDYMETIIVYLTISHGWTKRLPFINKASVNNLVRMFIHIQVVTQVNFPKSRGNQEEHTTQSTDNLGNPMPRSPSPTLLLPHITCLSSPLSSSFCFSSLPVPTRAPQKGTDLLLDVGASVTFRLSLSSCFPPDAY